MTYDVVLTQNAKSNLRSYYEHAAQRAPATAARWLDRFEQALDSLAVNPQRCGLAPENDLVDIEVRQLLFGKRPHTYRALFTVDGDQVQVLHVRRATMDNATADDLFSPDVE
jgi:plasmid stabilization system protein ParE